MFPLFDLGPPAMTILPVEMLAMILRCLNPESLLNAALSNKYFMRVCRGDPVLREMIRQQIKKEKELRLQTILDAKSGIVVLRNDPPKMFNPNVQKSIRREKVKPIVLQPHSGLSGPMVRTFTIVPEASRKKGGGKLRQLRKGRTDPYKTLRC